MNHILPHQPDDPGPDYGPLTFSDSIGGRSAIFLGSRPIGEIKPRRAWHGINRFEISIYLGTQARKRGADNPRQAKVFAMQEVQDWLSGTPLRLVESRGT